MTHKKENPFVIKSRNQFRGRTFIVTGGTQGLGKKIAHYLATNGAKNIVICGRNQGNGNATVSSLEKTGCNGIFVQADLANEEECRKVVSTCNDSFGEINGLVNAAGVTTRGTLDSTSIRMWDTVFAVNVRAPFILMKEVIPIMRCFGKGGSIVNIISMSSYGGQPYLTAYSASKGALATLTKNVAYAHRTEKIRVNGINIGWTHTQNEDLVQKSSGRPENWLELADASMPLGKILRPLDVAKLVAFLLSDDSALMTGSLIEFGQKVMGCYD